MTFADRLAVLVGVAGVAFAYVVRVDLRIEVPVFVAGLVLIGYGVFARRFRPSRAGKSSADRRRG